MYVGLLCICRGPIPELECLLREHHQATAYFRHGKAITWDSNYTATQLCCMIEMLKCDAFICKAVLQCVSRPWVFLWFCFGHHQERNTYGQGIKESLLLGIKALWGVLSVDFLLSLSSGTSVEHLISGPGWCFGLLQTLYPDSGAWMVWEMLVDTAGNRQLAEWGLWMMQGSWTSWEGW